MDNITDQLAELGARHARRLCLAFGVFDGVHLGHQAIIRALTAAGERLNAVPIAVTFEPHPRRVVDPTNAPQLLVSPNRRVELLRHYGAAEVLIMPFTEELAQLEPEAFLDAVSTGGEKPAGITVGCAWRFGRNGAGNAASINAFAGVRGIEFMPVAELSMLGDIVSSSRIRAGIARGQLAEATVLLGRSPELEGTVEHGMKLAANKLARPTANLAVEYGVLPPDGVYAALAHTADGRFPAAINIGLSPTIHRVNMPERRVEVHLLGYSGDLYGQRVRVELKQFIREERCFGSLAELKEQIDLDISRIRGVL